MECFEGLWPYSTWRPGQREIAEKVYRGVKERSHTLVGYPTGAGKTAAVLVGALAAARECGLRIIYLVRAKSQFQAPLRELRRIRRKLEFNAVFIQSKRDMCLIRGSSLLPYDEFLRFCNELVRAGLCPYYARSVKARVELSGIVEYRRLLAKAGEVGACPYELAKRALRNADIIVAAYNYLFEPDIRRVFLKEIGVNLEDVLLIVDEAHNLPQAVVNILSKEIRRQWVKVARREVSRYCVGEGCERLVRGLYALYSFMGRMRRVVRRGEVELDRGELMEVAPNPAELSRAAALIESRVQHASVLRRVAAFLRVALERRAGYTLVAALSDGDVSLRALCISPASETSRIFRAISGSILMSGTLPPRDYMVYMLGLGEERTRELRLPLPWANRVRMVAVRGVSSRLVERGARTYRLMAKAIDDLYSRLEWGTGLVVAPSYDMAKALRAYVKSRPIFMEREDTRVEDLVKAARSYERLLVFCVAWGKLVEGIELKLDGASAIRLVIIAGLPVPEPSVLNRKLVEVLRYKVCSSELAWRLVYMVPAAVRVVQAVGRSVRSERDYAMVAMLDERILEPYLKDYVSSFGYNIRVVTSVEQLSLEYESFLALVRGGKAGLGAGVMGSKR